MKIYIKAAVSIENLKKQFAPEMEDELFQQLIDLDPTADFEKNKGGKYCPWIFRQYNKGHLKEDNFTNVKDALGYFVQNYKKYPKTDLGQYKTIDEFLQDTETVGNRQLTDKEKAKLLKKQAHAASDQDKKFLVADGAWEVWQPLTHPGSVSLARTGGKKASWCTAYEGGDTYYWDRYTKQGPLYIFINTSDPEEKYQLHFESNSWYDINDRSLGLERFYQFCAEHPTIGEFFEIKTENGIQTRADSIIGFDENATEIIIPDGITTLPSSIRLPHNVEKVVFPDSMTNLSSNVCSDLSHLVSVKLPNKLTSIPRSAFKGCSSLTEISIPDTVTTYDSSAFAGCTALAKIKHSARLEVVGDNCFDNCISLTSMVLPDTVNYLGVSVFDNVPITSFKVPSNVDKINKTSFRDSLIEEIDLNDVTAIGANAFRNSKTAYIDLSKVKAIGSSAFRECNNLTGVEFNSEGVVVGPYAFANSVFEPISNVIVIHPTTELSVGVFDDCPNVTIEWDKDDEDYEFYNIKELIVDEKKCPKLVKANKGYVPIRTHEGKFYEATEEE